MSRMDVKRYSAHNKLNGGPGGWGCPCCNPYCQSPNKMKPKARRLARRVEKMEFKKNVC